MNRGTIRDRARRKLDELTEKFWDDEDLNDAINQGYYFYWQWLLEAVHPAALKEANLTATANTATIAKPADFIKGRLFERILSTGKTQPLNFKERYEASNVVTAATGDSYLPDYRFVGVNIRLEPTPIATFTNGFKLTYFFIPSELSLDADSPDAGFSPLYHWLLVYYAVIAAKEKEEALGLNGVDFGPVMKAREELELKFKETIETESLQRQYVEPFTTDDVTAFT